MPNDNIVWELDLVRHVISHTIELLLIIESIMILIDNNLFFHNHAPPTYSIKNPYI